MADHRQGYASNSPDGPEDRDRDRRSGTGSELRSRLGFGNDDPPGQYGRGVQSWGQANEGGNWGSGHRQSGSPRFGPQDQLYLDWRERQIAELDRDYEDYCRERGEDFQSSFDSWRRSRSSGTPETDDMTSGTSGSTGSAEPRTAQTRSKR